MHGQGLEVADAMGCSCCPSQTLLSPIPRKPHVVWEDGIPLLSSHIAFSLPWSTRLWPWDVASAVPQLCRQGFVPVHAWYRMMDCWLVWYCWRGGKTWIASPVLDLILTASLIELMFQAVQNKWEYCLGLMLVLLAHRFGVQWGLGPALVAPWDHSLWWLVAATRVQWWHPGASGGWCWSSWHPGATATDGWLWHPEATGGWWHHPGATGGWRRFSR